MFYENYIMLCREKGLSPSKVAEINGINKSNVTVWKNKGYVPRSEVVKKLADYFGVSIEMLLNGKEPDDDIGLMQDELFEKRKVLFDLSKKVRKEDIDMVTEIIKKFVDGEG